MTCFSERFTVQKVMKIERKHTVSEKKNSRILRRIVATLGAAAVATLGVTTAASAASTSTIDGSKTGSINITKYKGETGVAHDGTEIPAGSLPTNEKVAGAEFTLYPVNGYDLTTDAGWHAAEALISSVGPNPSKAALEANVTLGTPVTGVTDANGQVSFSGLPLGLYYAVESKAPAGLQNVAPFLVTLPLSNPTGDGWMYDVYLYPKDADGSTKVPMDDQGPKAGETLTWKINSVIRDDLSYLKVRDDLDKALEYVSTVVSVGGVTMTTPTEYTVTTSDISGTNPDKGTRVDVEFTPAGINTLTANAAAGTVEIKINTRVVEGFEGVIDNAAYIFNNEGSEDFNTSTPITQSKYGTILINKVAREGGAPLSGAEFDVYSTTSDTFDEASATKLNDTKLVTDANGRAGISGLRWSTFANGEEVVKGNPGYVHYWLVETKAPSGFQTLAEPIEVELNANSVTKVVENVKIGAGITLPFTGGTGTALFIGAGVLLLAGTGLIAVRRSRTNSGVNA